MGFFQGSIFQDPEIINAFSGAVAGALTATFVCPLDVLKTRLQVQRIASTQRVGIVGGLAGIVQQEGVKGLYRGLTPTLMALLPNWAVYFTVYGRLKTTLTSRPNGRQIPATPAIHMAAAAGAGVATLLVTNPLWVVKTRLQTQHMDMSYSKASLRPYRGTFDALARITREEGMRGLYSGLAPSMAGICHVAIQFPLYEAAKLSAANRRGVRADELSASELVITSAFSKMVASTITYPHEVVRSYMHVTGSGPLAGLGEACRVIFREDGLRGFYRGCATNLLRTTPAAALTFTSFELIARALRKLSEPARQQQEQQGLEDLADYQQLQEQPRDQQQQEQDQQQFEHDQQLQQQFQRGYWPLFAQGQGQEGSSLRGKMTLNLPGQQAPFIAHRAGAAQLAAELQHLQRQRHLASGAPAAAGGRRAGQQQQRHRAARASGRLVVCVATGQSPDGRAVFDFDGDGL